MAIATMTRNVLSAYPSVNRIRVITSLYSHLAVAVSSNSLERRRVGMKREDVASGHGCNERILRHFIWHSRRGTCAL